MAVTLLNNATGMVKGMVAETGVKIESFRQTFEPQFIEPSLDEVGHRDGAAVGHDKCSMTLSGEIVWTTGSPATTGISAGPFTPTFVTAVTTIANDDADLATAGTIYMTSIELTKNRGGWQQISADFESYEDQV